MKVNKSWSEEETQQLKELYPTHTNKELAIKFNTTKPSISCKARTLNLTKEYKGSHPCKHKKLLSFANSLEQKPIHFQISTAFIKYGRKEFLKMFEQHQSITA